MSDHSVKSLMALERAAFLSLPDLVMRLWVKQLRKCCHARQGDIMRLIGSCMLQGSPPKGTD